MFIQENPISAAQLSLRRSMEALEANPFLRQFIREMEALEASPEFIKAKQCAEKLIAQVGEDQARIAAIFSKHALAGRN